MTEPLYSLTGLNMADAKKLISAINFAAQKHKDQRRKDADLTPYINHPLNLLNILANEAGVTDLVTLISAVLHDTIEDTEATANELTGLFGAEVTAIVLEVTDDKTLDKSARKARQIETAPKKSLRAKHVKLADKIANLRDVADSPPARWTLERRQEYFDWAKAVVDALGATHPTLEHLFHQAYSRRPT